MSEPSEQDLIYDWNQQELPAAAPRLIDHTLVSVQEAPLARAGGLEASLKILEGLHQVGIQGVCLPSGPHRAALLERTLELGMQPFVWDSCEHRIGEVGFLSRCSRSGARRPLELQTNRAGPWRLVIEDPARTHPDDLVDLLCQASKAGASGVVLADEAGWAIRAGVRNLVALCAHVERDLGHSHWLAWSGGNQRSLALSNALEAWRCGCHTLHASVFGLGSGSGQIALELLLVNLSLAGVVDQDLTALAPLCDLVAETFAIPIFANHPVVGRDAFRTGTGVHAAAIVKAYAKGHDWLADLIYSGVPASRFGFRQQIEIGPMAGASNVLFWLRAHGLEPDGDLVSRILDRAKASERVLSDAEVWDVIGAL